MSLPNLLFVTPSLPSPLGTGSMLRAAMTLEALRKTFRVHVLNLNTWTWGPGRPSFLMNRAASYVDVAEAGGDVDAATLVERYFRDVEFVAIHTFKLVMARVTMGMLAGMKGPRPYLVLDLDDDECSRSAGMLALMEQEQVDLPALKRARADEMQLRMLERMMVPRFQGVALAGVDDCPVLAKRYPAVAVHHLPNAVDLPDNFVGGSDPKERDAVVKLLFVGALYYAPNADGICYFVEQVLPLVQEMLGGAVRLSIVGAEPLRSVSALAENPAVTIHANVPSLVPFYEDADICIVPLRAGSGTRIKILEAFSFRRPVVSTHLGASGLQLADGEQLLLADDPAAMARACVSLIEDRALRERMVNAAYTWVGRTHSVANVEAAMESIYRPVLQRS